MGHAPLAIGGALSPSREIAVKSYAYDRGRPKSEKGNLPTPKDSTQESHRIVHIIKTNSRNHTTLCAQILFDTPLSSRPY